MPNPYPNQNGSDLDDLLRQVDDLLEPQQPGAPCDGSYDNDYDDDYDGAYDPDAYSCSDDTMVFQNYSNHYGADLNNYANGYGGRQVSQPRQERQSIPAYNADFKNAPRESAPLTRRPTMGQKAAKQRPQPVYDDPIPPVYGKPKKQRRRGCGCGCSTVLMSLLVLVVVIFGAISLLFRPPKSPDSIGSRKRDSAAVLLCGVDKDGTRTDTMMLVYMSGSEHKVGLLSIPRDTYVLTSGGYDSKLNAIYGLNNCGTEGMEGLFDHIENLIGYRPDGYMLVDFDLVPQITDLMGGVTVNVPNEIDEEGIYIPAGEQALTGEQVLMLLRHRSSYSMADLTRIEVQRSVIKACMEQWLTPSHLSKAFSALDLVENNSISSLSVPNYLWMAKTILLNMGSFSTDTLPGYADMMGGVSYYFLYPEDVAQLINDSYNPYKVEITSEDLDIAG